MVVAYVLSLTLLPALIRSFTPPPEPKPLTLPALAPADAFLKRHRIWVISITILIVLAGLPALTKSCSIEKPWLPPHAFCSESIQPDGMLPTYRVFRTVQLMRAVARR